jgi:GT2 family glycosyltransferase
MGETNVMISILMCVYNVEKYIHECIESILNQTVKNYEVIILDDGSTDKTKKIIEKFDDERIKFFINKENIGIEKSRNKCIKLSNKDSKYLFFTDGDCTVTKNWIEQGLIYLKEKEYDCVEGLTYYVSEQYEPTFSDGTYIRENKEPGRYMTCNIAYKKSVIENVGGFDEKYIYLSDRDLALKVAKAGGQLSFNPEMIVYHQKITLKPRNLVLSGKRIRDRVLLYKKYKDKQNRIWRIMYPKNLLQLIFPPFVFLSLFRRRYKTKEDYILFPFIYIMLLYERLNLWNVCIQEKVFLM